MSLVANVPLRKFFLTHYNLKSKATRRISIEEVHTELGLTSVGIL